jgi:group I intron endonuclease
MTTTSTVQQGIYQIVNIQNDHFYIGSSVNLHRRKTRHFSELRTNKHNNKHLQAAWNKYGEASFRFNVVELVAQKDVLHVAEDRWLAAHVGKQYCYNVGRAAISPMLGLCGPLSPTWGYKHTPEAREKIATASSVRIQSNEEKFKRRETMRGTQKTAAVRAKISATLSGEGNFWYGKERSEDFKAKIRKSVVVTDAAGVETIYPSVQAVREALQLKPPTVNRALKSGMALVRGPHIGLSFKYRPLNV